MTTPDVPNSREAGESTLGSVLINPDTYHDVATFIQAEDFYIHRNQWVWGAISRLNERGTPIDILTVANELERHGQIEEVGGPAYLTALVSNVYDSGNAEHYARIIEAHSIRRKMLSAAYETAKLAYSSMDADDALNKAHEVLQGITPSSRGSKISLADRVLEAVLTAKDSGDVPGIHTGLASLDTITGGFGNSELIYVAGRPGMGKSGLLTTNARAALRTMNHVVFFSLEMGDVSVAQRFIAQEKDTRPVQPFRGRMTDDEWDRFNAGLDWLRGLEETKRLIIFERSGLTASQIHSHAKRLYVRGLCDILYVDYVQLMTGKGENRASEVSYCSRGLKIIAQDLHIPVVAAAQLNRDIEKRSNPKPVLSDLKESGSLEQDADKIIFIWDNSKDGEKVANAKIDPALITVAKHRNGPVGDLIGKNGEPRAQFVRRSTKFEDA